jgi:hypothetical protein
MPSLSGILLLAKSSMRVITDMAGSIPFNKFLAFEGSFALQKSITTLVSSKYIIVKAAF